MVQRLGCSMECGIFSDQGLNLHWQVLALAGEFFTPEPPEEPLIVVLICISLTSSNAEHLITCLLAHLYVFFGEMSTWVYRAMIFTCCVY